jgi:magnesium chelatase family protein
MVAQTFTVAFEGSRPGWSRCNAPPSRPAVFSIVGLPDKAVSEARERVRAALSALSIALPAKRITINLSPADLPKEGSHFDLPIALALLAALEIMPRDEVAGARGAGRTVAGRPAGAGGRGAARRHGAAEEDRRCSAPRLRARGRLGRCGQVLAAASLTRSCAITPGRRR